MRLVTSAQMRAIEQRAIDAGTSVEALMDAAGLAVAQEAWLSLGVVAGRRVVVLCGPGNNGGDGLVAARYLAEWDADVVVYLLAERDGSDAKVAALRELGVPMFVAAQDEAYRALDDALGNAEMILDALLGTGRSRPVEGALAEILRRIADVRASARPPRIVAVDLPTGVDADSGAADPLAVRADLTVTFGLAKIGLFTPPGAEYAGRVEVVDIGLPAASDAEAPIELLDVRWVRERLPERAAAGNKGTFGRVLVVAGSDGYVGAARLAATACYRAGAGFVTVACTPRLQAMIAPSLAEATYLLRDGGDGDAKAILDALKGYDVLLIGPGLGQSDATRATVLDVLRGVPDGVRACVLDADALNTLARTDAWSDGVQAACVLTPHPGEMARLRATDVASVQGDRLRTALDAAAEWKHVVVLKGAHTVIASPDGRAALSPHANPLLASAGTGDVLAGVIAGFAAQGMAAFEAAAAGAYVHGMAGEELRAELGDRGLLASDLLGMVPRVVRIIREGRPAPPVAPGRDLFSALMNPSEAGPPA